LFSGACGLLPASAFAERNYAGLQPGSHTVQLEDVKIHYVVSGHGPLVFVTSVGWGWPNTEYQNAFKPLEAQFTVIYVEERGNGDSSLPADLKQMSITVMANDLDHLRAYLGLDKINVIGHSSGGSITLEYAEKHPTHLEKGVLVDASVQGSGGHEIMDGLLSLWKGDPKYKEAIRNLPRSDHEQPTDAEATEVLKSYLNLYFSDPDKYVPVFLKQAGNSQVRTITRKAYEEANSIAAIQQLKDVSAIQAKLLIINGTVDFVCPYQVAQHLHAKLPNSVLELYANVGHFPWIEEPGRFYPEVTNFLNK
jgi:pimeloyl-ACP methyl ester carboxylesterase